MRAGRDEGGSHICATRTILVARRGPCGLQGRAVICGAGTQKGAPRGDSGSGTATAGGGRRRRGGGGCRIGGPSDGGEHRNWAGKTLGFLYRQRTMFLSCLDKTEVQG